MILCDRDIAKAIEKEQIIITPAPGSGQYDSSALNLRVGDDFRIWKGALQADATRHIVDLDSIVLSDLIGLTDVMMPDRDGAIIIEPKAFVIVRTLEHIYLPKSSKLAARVEGRSKQARLGMTAHITAPTIHSGFAGRITLEIINHGPFHLQVRPRESMLCQLIFEKVSGVAQRGGSSTFSEQDTPLGTQRRPQRRR